jgi:hypothetical protein
LVRAIQSDVTTPPGSAPPPPPNLPPPLVQSFHAIRMF